MPEISDQDLAVYQRGLALLQKMEQTPGAKPHLEAAIKVLHPEVATSAERVKAEVEPLMAPVVEALGKINARFEEQDAKATERENAATEASLTAAFSDLSTKRGFTDEAIAKVKELMIERSIPDPYAAAALFTEQNPKPVDVAPSWKPDGWDINSVGPQSGAERDLVKEGLFKDEDAWADKEAANALNEIRIGKAA